MTKEELEQEIHDAINRFESASGSAVYRIELIRDLFQEKPPVEKCEVILY